MEIKKLQLINYKNYEEVNLDFDLKINVLVGKNGSGKTNLLDAIYYLSLTKSAFASSDNHCVKQAESYFMVKGVFQKDTPKEIIGSFQAGKKNFKEDKVDYSKLTDHIGKYPVVLMAPDDVDLVKDGSESRRKFFDGLLCQIDKVYLENLVYYTQILKQRNGLLRMFQQQGTCDWVMVESYDAVLIQTGNILFQKRLAFMAEFEPVFQKYFNFIVSDAETSNVTYTSDLRKTSFEEGLRAARSKDTILQRTTFGVHRDDYTFALGNGDLKRLGSQGQQKSFVIALKLAQYEIMESIKGYKPILLLDDIFDKLDDFRIAKLMELIHQELGQLFMTDARPDRTKSLLEKSGDHASVFHVNAGKIQRL